MCDVSPPFSIHWNITRRGSGVDGLHITNVSTVTNELQCRYDLQHQFHQPGNYVMKVSVDNGVSEAHTYYNVSVDSPKIGKQFEKLLIPALHLPNLLYMWLDTVIRAELLQKHSAKRLRQKITSETGKLIEFVMHENELLYNKMF